MQPELRISLSLSPTLQVTIRASKLLLLLYTIQALVGFLGLRREGRIHELLFSSARFLHLPSLLIWIEWHAIPTNPILQATTLASSCNLIKHPKISYIKMMAVTSYYSQAELLVRDYLFSTSYIPYTSFIVGILMCKLSYDLTQLISSFYLKRYAGLSKIQCVEWNNRGISTVHAIFITAMSIYFVFFSNFYSDDRFAGLITSRSSPLSAFTLGVSAGYFIVDLGMIFWLYPSLGGMEYVIHHLISLAAVVYSMLSGEGQLYVYMVLISETTTPAVNLRWYLDTAGMKRSRAYLVNGVFMFFAWLVARILLFMYVFYHIYLHYEQVEQMHTFGYISILIIPCVLTIMNLVWFWKIIKGLMKTMAKRH